MLQQILRDMWVDPEILVELDEQQKQTLFCKMREEQVRRWKLWDEKADSEDEFKKHPRPESKKKVGFLLGEDGEPWVWVMGEHKDDKSYETILEEEAKETARKLAEYEAEQLRLSVEAELDKLLEENKKQIALMEIEKSEPIVEDIYCSVDELKIRPPVINNNSNKNNYTTNNNNTYNYQTSANFIQNNKRDALQEISFNKQNKVSQRVALWEQRLMEEKTSEIFQRIQKKKIEAEKAAAEEESKQEQLWKEQQRKAKEAEQQRREIARRAREEYRRSLLEVDPETGKPPLPPHLPRNYINSSSDIMLGCSKPPNKDAVVEWFRSKEILRRAGLEQHSNDVAPWFHGMITRSEAESLLSDKPAGSFLVRVSERIWGYAISYKDSDRCKHYLVDASNGHYQFLGSNQISHNTLSDLIKYHESKPITVVGGELLGQPCHRKEALPSIFQGLVRAR